MKKAKKTNQNLAERLRFCAIFLIFSIPYFCAQIFMQSLPRTLQNDGLRVHMPVPLQVVQAFGDRYLAANFGVIRSATVDTRVTDKETFRIQSQIAEDVSFLNAAHEDNYYHAAAMLPWQGFVKSGQTVLERASHARPWDELPAFFYAFNASYFEGNYIKAAKWAEKAADRVEDEEQARSFRVLAAKWYARGDDPALGIEMIKRLKSLLKNDQSIPALDMRIQRLEGLIALREAAAKFALKNKRLPADFDELIDKHYLNEMPFDPLKLGYVMDSSGNIHLASQK